MGNPVDVLMSITLGGGTNITKAVQYAHKLAVKPKKTLIILVTDFYEGGNYDALSDELISIRESGIKLIGIGALGKNAAPSYNRDYAKKVNKIGFDVLSCTPEELAPLVGKIIEQGG